MNIVSEEQNHKIPLIKFPFLEDQIWAMTSKINSTINIVRGHNGIRSIKWSRGSKKRSTFFQIEWREHVAEAQWLSRYGCSCRWTHWLILIARFCWKVLFFFRLNLYFLCLRSIRCHTNTSWQMVSVIAKIYMCNVTTVTAVYLFYLPCGLVYRSCSRKHILHHMCFLHLVLHHHKQQPEICNCKDWWLCCSLFE